MKLLYLFLLPLIFFSYLNSQGVSKDRIDKYNFSDFIDKAYEAKLQNLKNFSIFKKQIDEYIEEQEDFGADPIVDLSEAQKNKLEMLDKPLGELIKFDKSKTIYEIKEIINILSSININRLNLDEIRKNRSSLDKLKELLKKIEANDKKELESFLKTQNKDNSNLDNFINNLEQKIQTEFNSTRIIGERSREIELALKNAKNKEEFDKIKKEIDLKSIPERLSKITWESILQQRASIKKVQEAMDFLKNKNMELTQNNIKKILNTFKTLDGIEEIYTKDSKDKIEDFKKHFKELIENILYSDRDGIQRQISKLSNEILKTLNKYKDLQIFRQGLPIGKIELEKKIKDYKDEIEFFEAIKVYWPDIGINSLATETLNNYKKLKDVLDEAKKIKNIGEIPSVKPSEPKALNGSQIASLSNSLEMLSSLTKKSGG